MPTVSVIIPTFNRANLLAIALQSLCDQTYHDFEVLVVDDGSTDKSASVVEDFYLKDPRFFYYYQENKGRSAAKNYGIKIARGKYVTFLDSDDVYLPEKLMKEVYILDSNPQIGWVYCLYSLINQQGSPIDYKTRNYNFTGNIYPDIIFLNGTIVTTPAVMLRRDVLGKAGFFDEKMDICEDIDLWRRVSKIALVDQIQEKLIMVRRRTGEPAPLWDNYRGREYFYNKALLEDPAIESMVRKTLYAEMYTNYAYDGLHRKMFLYSTYLLLKLLCLGPVAYKYLMEFIRMKFNHKQIAPVK